MKKILTLLFLLSFVFFGLVACETETEKPQDTHTHTFATMYSCDEEYHWYQATCEHVDEVREKEEHEWNSGVVTKEPTADAEGTKVYTCTVCGYEKTVTLDPESSEHIHIYSDSWSKDANYHWHASTCGHDTHKDKAEHSWDITTTDTLITYTCTVCGQTKTEEVENTDDIVPTSTITSKLQYIDIEVGETYNISSLLNELSGMTLSMDDNTLASYSSGVLTGKKEGVTKVTLKHNNKEQVVRLEVHAKGALGTTFTFDEYRLTGKNIVAFGDSVTDYVTNNAKSYYERFADIFGMNAVKNYAIGGTTAHYGYAGSNLYNEYFYNGSWITDGAGRKVVDGPQRVKNAYDANELANIDYVFIAYTHNDQHFQPVPTHDGYDDYNLNSFDSCASFKGSYIYMIETLKLANPDIRIILMAPTYAMYDVTGVAHNGNHYYGKEYNYSDYRQMIKEAAAETNTKYVNSWNYLKDYFDSHPVDGGSRTYYNDIVHLSKTGQQVLAEYLANGMTGWYLNGEFADSTTDADYQFAVADSNRIKLNLTVTSKELNKEFVISNGKKVLNGSNVLSGGNILSITSDKKIKFTEEGEYTIVINTNTNDITVTKKRDAVIYYTVFDSSSSYARVKAAYLNKTTGLYEFEVDFIQWGTIQINYNGNYLSTSLTSFTGEIGPYAGATGTNLYAIENTTTTFACSNSAGGTYKFVYNPKDDSLEISVKEIEEDDSGLTYSGTYNGTATKNSDGTWSYTVDLKLWNSVLLKYNGIIVTVANTEITGAFVGEVASAPYNTKLYTENGLPTMYSSYNGTNTYTFTYTPAQGNNKAQLYIDDHKEVTPKVGFSYEIEANINADTITVVENSDGTYTMTFTTTRNWAVIDLYYNNTLLTWNNVTATGNVCSAYGTMNGAANILYWGSDSGLGWCAYDKANDGGETYTLVYNPTANTLVVSYK